MDLFSVFLTKFAEWGFGKILDIAFVCSNPLCRNKTYLDISNQQTNYLECSNCHKVINQFTNACDFTLNPKTRQIGHAIFKSGTRKWDWPGMNVFYQPERFSVPFNILIEGLKGRAVILTTSIKRYSDEEFIIGHQSVLYPMSDWSPWEDYAHLFHQNNFSLENRTVLALDAKLESEFHDILFEDRRIIKPWK